MIYLSGHVHSELVGDPDFGFMLTPRMGNLIDFDNQAWAADTGSFSGRDTYSVEYYLKWLKACSPKRCLFATAPDFVGNALLTLGKACWVLPLIRELGYKAALVAQDGFENLEPHWDGFDCLFIGGTTKWKLGPMAQWFIREAKQRNKWVHVGRVNSGKRFRMMRGLGADSVDGTFLKVAPNTNLIRLRRWVKAGNAQEILT